MACRNTSFTRVCAIAFVRYVTPYLPAFNHPVLSSGLTAFQKAKDEGATMANRSGPLVGVVVVLVVLALYSRTEAKDAPKNSCFRAN